MSLSCAKSSHLKGFQTKSSLRSERSCGARMAGCRTRDGVGRADAVHHRHVTDVFRGANGTRDPRGPRTRCAGHPFQGQPERAGASGRWKSQEGDFPGGPVVKTPPSNAGDSGSIPGQGTKIPQATQQLSPRTITRGSKRCNKASRMTQGRSHITHDARTITRAATKT